MMLHGSNSGFSVSSGAFRRGVGTPIWLVLAWFAIWFGGTAQVQAAGQVNVSDKIAVAFTGLTLNRYTNTFDTVATLTNTSAVAISQPVVLTVTGTNPSAVTLANAGGQTADGFPYVTVPLVDGRFDPGERVTNVILKFNNSNRVGFTFGRAVYGTLPSANHAPTANAGPDQSVYVGQTVTLDGSASSDLDGDPLTYQWSLIQQPPASTATLTSATGLVTGIIIDKPGSYTLRLIVNDGQTASAPVSVVISTLNSKPVAHAGPDQTAAVGQTVIFEGSASSDADGDLLTYLWSLTQRPTNGNLLVDPNTDSPRLTVNKPGHYEARLVVNDGSVDSDPDLVAIDTRNSPPVANAGADAAGYVGDTILLDGGASSDVDGDLLTYAWSLLSKPAGSAARLLDDTAQVSSVQPDLAGDYVAQLIVDDGTLGSEADTAKVTVSVRPPPINHAPVITSAPGTRATVGLPYQYTVIATDQDGDALSFSLTVAPAGMTIDTQSGLIQWTPDAGQDGDAPVSVKVLDSNGAFANHGFTITVDPVDDRVTAPALIGLTRAAAEGAIRQAQFNVGVLSFRNSTEADGIVLEQSLAAGAKATIGTPIDLSVSLGPDVGLPPNPETVAPPVDPTVTTTVADASRFLYSGDHPIQTGVATGAIDAKRAAVVRGKVLDKQNNPLPGVTITIKDHPELGQTLSRADGWFDLAVNGGGYLTINYQKAGYLPAQRQANAPWQDFVVLDEAILITRDAQVITIDLANATTMQAALGSPVTDQDGTRQPALLIPAGTTAARVMPDGSTQPLATLSLRFTEYTVGANGPATMPASLPPNVAYTYALEISTDEAPTKLNGKDVIFNQPVPFYVDNFLDFPVGGAVPVGYYDSTKGAWIPYDNGRIIKILSISGGLAQVDVTGSGTPADAAALAALGMTEVELEKLATLYPAGKSLWRVQLDHLSWWDCNWTFGPPGDSAPPPPQPNKPPKPNPCSKGQCCQGGENTASGNSVIGCESQTLSESIPLVGSQLALHYSSDQVPGNTDDRTVDIALSGATIPASLKRIEASVTVAGKKFDLGNFPLQPNQTKTFTWDGRDAYGQTLRGTQSATIEIGYVYDGVYQRPVRFGASSGVPIPGRQTRQEFTFSRQVKTLVGTSPDMKQLGIAGWSLDLHHVYDPSGGMLYQGDRSRRNAKNMNDVITSFSLQSSGNAYGVATAADGTVFVADGSSRIFRVGSDGIVTTFAGGYGQSYGGDGGPATQAKLNRPFGVAIAPDGSVLIADTDNHRIRRVDSNGIITTYAGNGTTRDSGDGGLATQAGLYNPFDVAVSADGSVLISDTEHHRIRRVGPDGIITTFAGNGTDGFPNGDDGPATQAVVYRPFGLAVANDGSVFIAASNRIRRVGPDGIISTFAGNGTLGATGDGGPATQASLRNPTDVTVAADGAVLIVDSGNDRIRKVQPDGVISTIAGNGEGYYSGDDGPPTQASLERPWGIAVAPDGRVLIGDSRLESFYYAPRIRAISPTLPGFTASDIAIASPDGRQIDRFNPYGRHLSTVDTLTGATLYTFDYDSAGRLIKITDADHNVTTIERDGSGNPTALIAPFGQRTTLTVDANGYLASVTNPAGEAYQLQTTADGLLNRFTDPRNHASTFAYDAVGRLRNDANSAGGSQTLVRTDEDGSYTVTRTSALNRTTAYSVIDLPTGDRQREVVTPDGLETITLLGTNGGAKTTAPDGTVTDSLEGPDPRFGMQSPTTGSNQVTTGGLTATTTSSATLDPVELADPLSFTTLTRTTTINGRASTSVYDKATRTTTVTSAAGRQSYSILDEKGRVTKAGVTGIEPITLSYDDHGHLKTLTQGSGVDSRATTFSYNVAGELQSATDALGHSGSLDYDLAGRVITQTLANGEEIGFGYDAKGNLTSLTPPGQPAHGFDYDAVDLATRYNPPTVPGGGDTGYQFNADKQLIQVTRPDGGILNYTYDDATGRLSTLTIPAGQYGYGYTAAGQLGSITAPGGIDLGFGYNGSLLADVTWSGAINGRVEFGSDTDFRVKQVSVNGADPVAYQYDADSLLIQAGDLIYTRHPDHGLLNGSTLGSVTDSLGYNAFGELSTYNATANGTALLNVTYNIRDKLGRIAQKVETVGSGAAVTYDYGYDAIGQLIEVKQDGVIVASYVYDANGNRLSKTAGGSTVTGTYDDQDRMLSYGNATYTYTANGELKTKTVGGQVTAYDYDALGNLRGVSLPDGRQIEYLIDGKNRRVGKKVNGALVQGFLYQGQLQPVAELDGSGAIVSRFVYGKGVNVPDYMVKGGVTYRLVADHLGSPRLVVNTATGAIVQRMDYDEYGNVLTDTSPGLQPFGFAGGMYDQDTGFVRFGARDYEAKSGRWMVKDPIGLDGGANIYGYVDNNPVNFIDLLGLFGDGYRASGNLAEGLGHSDFYGNDEFDYIKEDYGNTSPYILPEHHFRKDLGQLDREIENAIKAGDRDMFQRLMHQGQDTFGHAGYKWDLDDWVWGWGHLIDGTAPDKRLPNWVWANKWTRKWVEKWRKQREKENCSFGRI